jgi:hypothetical protein
LSDTDFFSEAINEFFALEAGKHPKYISKSGFCIVVCFTDDGKQPASVAKWLYGSVSTDMIDLKLFLI